MRGLGRSVIGAKILSSRRTVSHRECRVVAEVACGRGLDESALKQQAHLVRARAQRPGAIENLDSRFKQFGPHHPRDGSGDRAGDNREDQIERTYVLVVRGYELTHEEAWLVIAVRV